MSIHQKKVKIHLFSFELVFFILIFIIINLMLIIFYHKIMMDRCLSSQATIFYE